MQDLNENTTITPGVIDPGVLNFLVACANEGTLAPTEANLELLCSLLAEECAR